VAAGGANIISPRPVQIKGVLPDAAAEYHFMPFGRFSAGGRPGHARPRAGITGKDHRRLERLGHRKRSSSLGAAGAQETIPEGIAQQANGFVSVVICQQMAHLGCTVVAGKGV
jgi:hypothetical protein